MDGIEYAEYDRVTHTQQGYADRIYGFVAAEASYEHFPPAKARQDHDNLVNRVQSLVNLKVVVGETADGKPTVTVFLHDKVVRPVAADHVRDELIADWENARARRD